MACPFFMMMKNENLGFGLGLRAPHYDVFLKRAPQECWLAGDYIRELYSGASRLLAFASRFAA